MDNRKIHATRQIHIAPLRCCWNTMRAHTHIQTLVCVCVWNQCRKPWTTIDAIHNAAVFSAHIFHSIWAIRVDMAHIAYQHRSNPLARHTHTPHAHNVNFIRKFHVQMANQELYCALVSCWHTSVGRWIWVCVGASLRHCVAVVAWSK